MWPFKKDDPGYIPYGLAGATIGGVVGALYGGISSGIDGDGALDIAKDSLYGGLLGASISGAANVANRYIQEKVFDDISPRNAAFTELGMDAVSLLAVAAITRDPMLVGGVAVSELALSLADGAAKGWLAEKYAGSNDVLSSIVAEAENQELYKLAKLVLDISVGDIMLMGRFKNQRTVVKSMGYDELGQPIINGKKLLDMRIEKLLPFKKRSRITKDKELAARKLKKKAALINLLLR